MKSEELRKLKKDVKSELKLHEKVLLEHTRILKQLIDTMDNLEVFNFRMPKNKKFDDKIYG